MKTENRDSAKWFWDLIEQNKPNGQNLYNCLINETTQNIGFFHTFFELASQEICDYFNGPKIEGIGHISEDSTEDLNNWIVSMGFDYWKAIIDKEYDIEKAFWDMEDSINDKHTTLIEWTVLPKFVAENILKEKYQLDIYEIYDLIMNKTIKTLKKEELIS